VLTDVGPVEITVPRDHNGSFEPKVVAERQMQLTGVDEMVISLAARHLTTGRSPHAWTRCMARGGLPPDHLRDHRGRSAWPQTIADAGCSLAAQQFPLSRPATLGRDHRGAQAGLHRTEGCGEGTLRRERGTRKYPAAIRLWDGVWAHEPVQHGLHHSYD
jgi:hypothetical protein